MLAVLMCGCPAVAWAQSMPADPPKRAAAPPADPTMRSTGTPDGSRPGLLAPLVDVLGDFRRLPSAQNLPWFAAGLAAAAAMHPADSTVSRELSAARTQSFKPGAVLGVTPLHLGGALATYAIGLATDSPRATSLGGDLLRAQLMAEGVTRGLKVSVRRDRPDGTRFSFPSGHSAITFASATVLQQHFGWKVGIPAYAVATYVATSRVQMKRHYLSDVAFGAAIGIVAGRTVTLGTRHRFALAPSASTDGAGLNFVFVGDR